MCPFSLLCIHLCITLAVFACKWNLIPEPLPAPSFPQSTPNLSIVSFCSCYHFHHSMIFHHYNSHNSSPDSVISCLLPDNCFQTTPARLCTWTCYRLLVVSLKLILPSFVGTDPSFYPIWQCPLWNNPVSLCSCRLGAAMWLRSGWGAINGIY